jgi:hypothetical protein
MFRPVRLIVLAMLAAAVYFGFFAVPGGVRDPAGFDPDRLAAHEVAVWRAAQAEDDIATYLNVVQMLREQQRYTWYHAADAGINLARATGQFVTMTTRFERLLPDLEAVATVERDWRQASFKPAEVARAQLNWWVTLKSPTLNARPDVPRIIARDFGLRYGLDPSVFEEAAGYRAEAVKLRDNAKVDPDWPAITKLLARSYRSLRTALQHRAPTPARHTA